MSEEEATHQFEQYDDVMDTGDTFISTNMDPSSKRAANRRTLRTAQKLGAVVSFTTAELYSDSDTDDKLILADDKLILGQ